MSFKKRKALSASELFEAARIFQNKGWIMDSSSPKKVSVWLKYLDRAEVIPKETRELYFDLTSRFDRIELSNVVKHLCHAYNKIDKRILNDAKKIYFIPLAQYELPWYKRYVINKNSFFSIIKNPRLNINPNIKSSFFICRLFQQFEYRVLDFSEKFIFPSNYKRFVKLFRKDKDILILVDDFIGTGDTASSVLKELFKKSIFNSENTILLSLISLNSGSQTLKSKFKVELYQNILKGKGISDFYQVEEVPEKINLMKKMESAINCSPKISLGYKESEALVFICGKSPNNTFPVFWHETKALPAPFQRRKIYT